MSQVRGSKVTRSYRPTVEALEALRLLSGGATETLSGLAPALDVHTPNAGATTPLAPDLGSLDHAWDEVLTRTDLADFLGPAAPVVVPGTATSTPSVSSTSRTSISTSDTDAGLLQLNRYLSRAWYRAGVPAQLHDDATQAVYVTLLQNLGRTRFDALLGEVGQSGVKDVLSRETADGPDFFRAVDTVKKRLQREKTYQPIDAIDVATPSPGEDARALWRSTLQEAIDQTLTPREAALMHDTLMGKTPAEIAVQWGVAPKTVSNEKTRVMQKLREALVADLTD